MVLARFIDGLSHLWRRLSGSRPEDLRHRLGRRGERLAERHLRAERFKILYRNFRAPGGGEVDLVCRDRTCDTLVFVEVKTRRGEKFGAPIEAVDLAKQKLIARGALAWLRLLDHPEINYRFDVVEVRMRDDEAEIHLIRDAFPLPEPYF
jgi:putative endonuclease